MNTQILDTLIATFASIGFIGTCGFLGIGIGAGLHKIVQRRVDHEARS